MADNVRFPIYDASAIDDGDKWDVLAEIDFSKGGSFLLIEEIEVMRIMQDHLKRNCHEMHHQWR